MTDQIKKILPTSVHANQMTTKIIEFLNNDSRILTLNWVWILYWEKIVTSVFYENWCFIQIDILIEMIFQKPYEYFKGFLAILEYCKA